MSISAELQASARSAYRQLFRSANATFSGDDRVLRAFHSKMRHDALDARSETDPVVYASRTTIARDTAAFLRKNIVQASRASAEEDTWHLRITKDTELGSNDAVKVPLPESSRSMRRREKANQSTGAALHDPRVPKRRVHFTDLKRAHKERTVPELKEEDLEETFVRGSGPGGQSINKTENNVQLLHKPTGLRVSCQETRSLNLNRRYARRMLLEKLDQIVNPGLSKEQLKEARSKERERQRRKKAKKKQKYVESD
ncbi:RF-1 domain-containing protein [Mycena floridula]|nr:RF-1 domain-containing protein [Mycena floridula]